MGDYMYAYLIEAARMVANVEAAINASTGGILEIGGGGSGNRYAFIDFHGDDTYADFGLRLIRFNTGPNASSQLYHRGTGAFYLLTQEAAPINIVTTNVLRSVFTATGNLLLGDISAAGTNAVSVFLIKNGIPPASSPANAIQLYAEDVSASSELKARDEAGNTPTLTPHNFSLFTPDPSYYYPWSYYSKNPYLGKEINVDMYGAIRAIEELSGKQYIYTRDVQKESWEDNEELKRQSYEREQLEPLIKLEMEKKIEIKKNDAFDNIPITEKVQTGTTKKFKLVEEKAKIIKIDEPVFEDKPTGKHQKRLKSGVEFDEESGNFYQYRTKEEIEASINRTKLKKYNKKQMPEWMKQLK